MTTRNFCLVAILSGAMSVAEAAPVILSPAQMDAVTAGANIYADAVAQAAGQFTYTSAIATAISLNGLLRYLPGVGMGAVAANLAIATGLSAQVNASAKATIMNGQPNLAGYVPTSEVLAQAGASGPFTLAAASAGGFAIHEQNYLSGYAAVVSAPGRAIAITTPPIVFGATAGKSIAINGQPYWPPSNAVKAIPLQPSVGPGASTAVVPVTTEQSGSKVVTFTVTTGQPGSNAPNNGATMSLTFSVPPSAPVPSVYLIGLPMAAPVGISNIYPIQMRM